MEQGSPEWLAARIGKITASRMSDLMSRSKRDGSPLKACQDYMDELIGERITGRAADKPVTFAMERGTVLEPAARTQYAFERDVTVEECGFLIHPALAFVGASPDGLICDDGLLEIKCPMSFAKHIAALKDQAHAEEHRWQVQAQLWVTGREWCDLVSYHPDFPDHLQMAVVRVTADRAAWDEMDAMCCAAEARLTEMLADLEKVAA